MFTGDNSDAMRCDHDDDNDDDDNDDDDNDDDDNDDDNDDDDNDDDDNDDDDNDDINFTSMHIRTFLHLMDVHNIKNAIFTYYFEIQISNQHNHHQAFFHTLDS